jgi:hypothetical protein
MSGTASLRRDPFGVFRLRTLAETSLGLLAITAVCAPFGHMAVKVGTADIGWMRDAGRPPDPAAETLLLLSLFVAAVGWVLWKSKFWSWWLFWRPPTGARRLTKRQLAIRSVLAVVLLTEAFAIATAMIYVYAAGVFDLKHQLTEVLWPLERHYAWHLANAVPAVELSDTFHLNSPVTFRDPWGGFLLVAYKLLVIAPLITVGRVLIGRRASAQP